MISWILIVQILCVPAAFSQNSSRNDEITDEFTGSYMQDLVITYFNPDLEYSDARLTQESESITGYIVQHAKNLSAVLVAFNRELLGTRKRHPLLGDEEFKRRLLPLVEALNSELEKHNQEVRRTRNKIVTYSVIGFAVVGLLLAFFIPKKKYRHKKGDWPKRPLAYAILGGGCGALLAISASLFVGKYYPTGVNPDKALNSSDTLLSIPPPDETKPDF